MLFRNDPDSIQGKSVQKQMAECSYSLHIIIQTDTQARQTGVRRADTRTDVNHRYRTVDRKQATIEIQLDNVRCQFVLDVLTSRSCIDNVWQK